MKKQTPLQIYIENFIKLHNKPPDVIQTSRLFLCTVECVRCVIDGYTKLYKNENEVFTYIETYLRTNDKSPTKESISKIFRISIARAESIMYSLQRKKRIVISNGIVIKVL
jgi:hypothetical protein